MINKLNKQNYLLDYCFVFMLIVYAGKATTFVRAIESWENLLGLLFPIIFSLIIAFYYRVNISKRFTYLLIGFLIYNIALIYKFGIIHPRFIGIYLISFSISYIAISSLGIRIFQYYERILYYLCIIALFFWAIQFIIPETLKNILQVIAFSEPGSGNVALNIIIYTIPDVSGFESYVMNVGSFSVIRNAGFTWEPGAFACYINVAIFLNLIRTKFTLHNNRILYIFIITLITTFSTTGISIFMLLIIFYVYNQNLNLILITPIAIAIIFYISFLPLMTEKITSVSEYDTDTMIENAITYDTNPTPQRLESFQIDFIDFLNNPILGYGGHSEERWTEKLGANISTISGIGKVMAVFGIVGILFFIVQLTMTSMEFTKIFHFRGWGFQFFLIIMISISYSIIFTPLLMCFWVLNTSYLSNKLPRNRTMRYQNQKIYSIVQKQNRPM